MKIEKNVGVALIQLTLLSLSGCMSFSTVNSDQVSASEIYQTYRVTYDEVKGQLSSYADFRVGGSDGTTVNWVGGSSVSFDGHSLSSSDFLGTSYSSSATTAFSPSHGWVLTDRGQTYRNSVTIIPVALSGVPGAVTKGQPFTLTFTGPAIQAGDSVDAWIDFSTVVNGATTWDAIHASASGGQTLVFRSEDTARIPYGVVTTLHLKRTHTSALQEGTHLGGSVTSEYDARSLDLKVQ